MVSSFLLPLYARHCPSVSPSWLLIPRSDAVHLRAAGGECGLILVAPLDKPPGRLDRLVVGWRARLDQRRRHLLLHQDGLNDDLRRNRRTAAEERQAQECRDSRE